MNDVLLSNSSSATPKSSLNVLIVSTPVGPLGSGLGGGVELTVKNMAQALGEQGHHVHIIAPQGSSIDGLPPTMGVRLTTVAGALQDTAQTQGRETPITLPQDSVLAAMWDQVRQIQASYDIAINLAYDWLPFYLTDWLSLPIAHLVSMSSLNDAMDSIIQYVIERHPKRIGVYTHAQADTFAFGDRCQCLGSGLDLSLYEFQPESDSYLAWLGRIAPEKGIEDAFAAVQQTNIPLKVFGAMPDPDYWDTICKTYPEAPVQYEGFLTTQELQKGLGRSRGLLMTSKWIEAFGNVAIEALACGVPVISYRRGGPSEIVTDGRTGWLVEPDDVEGLVEAIAKLDDINRQHCRQRAENEYSLPVMGQRLEQWLRDILQDTV